MSDPRFEEHRAKSMSFEEIVEKYKYRISKDDRIL